MHLIEDSLSMDDQQFRYMWFITSNINKIYNINVSYNQFQLLYVSFSLIV